MVATPHMPDLSAYLNVYNTALVALERKGWALRFDPEQDRWFGLNDGWELLAEESIQLLGSVGIFEHHGPNQKSEYWWKIDKPHLLSHFCP